MQRIAGRNDGYIGRNAALAQFAHGGQRGKARSDDGDMGHGALLLYSVTRM